MIASRRRFLTCLAASGAASAAAAGARFLHDSEQVEPALFKAQRSSAALGTTVTITALHQNSDVATRAVDAALSEINLVESLLSLYRPDSQLCELNRSGILQKPHPYLVQVLSRAQEFSLQSHGAFDITVQPLWELFAAAKSNHALPTDAEINAARQRVNWKQVEVSSALVRLQNENTRITLNGIAQGFATDRAAAVLRAQGIEHALIDAGEIGATGANPRGEPWKIGIQHPRYEDAYISLARLAERCLASSGDYETTFSDDFKNNHIFDPRSGRSPSELASVSVVADNGMDADALSTAAFVLGTGQGAALIEDTPGAAAFFVRKDGSTMMTAGFPVERPLL